MSAAATDKQADPITALEEFVNQVEVQYADRYLRDADDGEEIAPRIPMWVIRMATAAIAKATT
jgi:hypothetical protein